ncbi:nucleotidyltransferase domain-containing protein [Candidatus Pacearchaeota archaeon]|nr:nucleotidyltransferase domain-containing protein [Candidatus Pacearchaeota archaeon]
MLNIINSLKPFFEDCYRRINVREYSRLRKISPPTASKILFELNKEGLLLIEKDRNYIFYYANKNNKIFVDLSRIYWNLRLDNLVHFLNKNLTNPAIILFGSLSKAETKNDSDIDICIIGHKKELNIKNFEDNLKRKIQLFFFSSVGDMKNKELANNIINGYILEGRLRL